MGDEDWFQALGYGKVDGERVLIPRGYRVLHQVPHLSDGLIQQVIRHYGDIRSLGLESPAELGTVEGVSQSTLLSYIEHCTQVNLSDFVGDQP